MCCSRSRPASLTEMQKRYADKGGIERVRGEAAAARRLDVQPDGQDRLHRTNGLRHDRHHPAARAHPQPAAPAASAGQPVERPLVDGAFVTVLVEGMNRSWRSAFRARRCCPTSRAITSTSSATTTRWSSAGSSWAVDAHHGGDRRRVEGGRMVIVEGIQRVRPGHRGQPGAGQPAAADATRVPRASGESVMISGVFIDRPRLAIVIAILLTLAGALSHAAHRRSRSSPTSCRRRSPWRRPSPAPRPRWWRRPSRSRWRRRSSASTR